MVKAMLSLASPITTLPSVTQALARRMKLGLGIETVRDLLYHLPERYENMQNVVRIKSLGENTHATIQGSVQTITVTRTWKRRLIITEALLSDDTGSVRAVWFNQPWVAQKIKQGALVLLSGKYTKGSQGLYFAPSFWEVLDAAVHRTPYTDLLAVYPETEGVTSKWLRWLVAYALKKIAPPQQLLPDEIVQQQKLLPWQDAMHAVHAPQSTAEATRGRERLEFEELFAVECAVLVAKAKSDKRPAPKIVMDVPLVQRFLATLPYKLTDGQRKAAFQILKDMETGRPMNRLLAGEVGSGKTVVAAIAMLTAARAKHQTVLMAPTEILAQQHFKTLAAVLVPFKLRVALLTGSSNRVTPKRVAASFLPISRPKLWKELAAGEIDVLVGTHALIAGKKQEIGYKIPNTLKASGPLRFKSLGLAIVDEQHRFGVNQRAKLAKMHSALSPIPHSLSPHFLTMTATPIPRSLALTIFGDLDISTMTELPKERQAVATLIIPPERRSEMYERIRTEVTHGHQAFVICPLVKKSEKLQAKAAEVEYERLAKEVFPDLRVGILHGQMDADEKEKTMRAMKSGKIDVLVATSVVEVGIDIPNATLIAIESAERYGLAQLYQLRGRVGRSEHLSQCLLLVERETPTAKKRLAAMQNAASGPELAQEDLKIRGAGELVGTRQSGLPDVAMQALANIALIERTREAAKRTLQEDLSLKQYPALRDRVGEITAELHLS